MKNRIPILSPYFCIQIFGEGAGGADGGTGDGGATGQSAEPAAAPVQPQTRRGRANPLADVQYGKQPEPVAEEPAAAPATEINPEERAARFDALIKGEFKDVYEQRLRDTISKRLKGNEETVSKYNALQPIMDRLSQKYGVDASDPEAVAKALDEDDSFFEQEAMDRGITVEQMKEIRKMQRENEALRAEHQQAQNREQADRLYAAWMDEAAQLKGVYANFDLNTELENEQFRALLHSNVPMQTAFEVIHKDEILPAAMQYAAKQVETKVANKIQASANRPREGAMDTHSAVTFKSDVSKLTAADRREIERRVARGERIVF